MSTRLLLDPAVTVTGSSGSTTTAVVEPPKVVAPPAAAPAPVVVAPPAEPAKPAAVVEPVKVATEPVVATWAKPAAKEPVADPAKAAAVTEAPKVEPAKEFALKAPEGVAIDAATLEGYKALSKDLGLTSEQAQKLYDRDSAAQQAAEKEAVIGIQKQDAAWLGEIQAKWGPNFQERSIKVSRAYDYADPSGEFRAKLSRAGLLNNPDLVNLVEKFGDLMVEDRIHTGATGVPKPKDNRPQQERLTEAFKLEAEKMKKKGIGK